MKKTKKDFVKIAMYLAIVLMYFIAMYMAFVLHKGNDLVQAIP